MSKALPFLLNGEWRTSETILEVRNPYDNAVIDTVYRCEPQDIREAIDSASAAFLKTRHMPAYKRSDILRNTAAGIESRQEELADLICREAGKPIRYARGEVIRAMSTLRIAAEEALRPQGETLSMDITPAGGHRLGIVQRFPLGPVTAISPFNFPLNLVCHKIGPALATGNTAILKPASQTPLTALVLGEILLEAGALPGSIHVLPCDSAIAGPLITDERIRMVSFTGSPQAGWGIKQQAGKKRVCLELGGNAGVIVEPDADLETAVSRCVAGAFAYAGQVCISVQRIFIHETLYDDFTDAFIEQTEHLSVGDPLLEDTVVGPVIDDASANRITQWVEDAVNRGAALLHGGEREGRLIQPVVLAEAAPDLSIVREEAFAPIVILDRYRSFEEALEKCNDSRYGLQAGVFTRDIEKAFRAFHELDVGGVMINEIPTYRVDHMPYGGVKDSGFGREGVRYAMEEMTELKLMVVDRGLAD